MAQWNPGGYPQQAPNALVDILDKVLDKGLVVAGDIQVSLANVELLTIKVRLLVCSVDKAMEIGLDWWQHDSFLSSKAGQANAELQARIDALERQLAASQASHAMPEPERPSPRARQPRRRRKTQDTDREQDQ
jgi:hypothetical protein